MMFNSSWKVIAPALIQSQEGADVPNDAEIFGSAVWLWMQGPNHRNLPLHALDRLLRPAVRIQQFALVMETDAPDIPPHWLYRTAAERAGGLPQGRNEPAELPRIAAIVAQLRGLSSTELAEASTRNACRVLPGLERVIAMATAAGVPLDQKL